jgi:hypothetical protein
MAFLLRLVDSWLTPPTYRYDRYMHTGYIFTPFGRKQRPRKSTTSIRD